MSGVDELEIFERLKAAGAPVKLNGGSGWCEWAHGNIVFDPHEGQVFDVSANEIHKSTPDGLTTDDVIRVVLEHLGLTEPTPHEALQADLDALPAFGHPVDRDALLGELNELRREREGLIAEIEASAKALDTSPGVVKPGELSFRCGDAARYIGVLLAERDEARADLEAERQASEARAVTLDGIRAALGTTTAGRGLVDAVADRARRLRETSDYNGSLLRQLSALTALCRAIAAELSPDGELSDRELLDLLRQRLRASAPESLYAGSPAADGRAVQALLDAHDYPLRDLGPVVRVMRLLGQQGVDLAGDAGGAP